MSNKEIARHFNLLANLMELDGENAFKTKTYASAYLVIRKWEKPFAEMADDEVDKISALGKSVTVKIKELLATGKIEVLEKYKEKTPEGIQQLLSVRGLGPKKVRVIWDELKVESPAELLYACTENRLIKLPGFGLKTQEDLRQKILYFLDSQDSYLYGNIEEELNQFKQNIQKSFNGHRLSWVGEFATRAPVISRIECLVSPTMDAAQLVSLEGVKIVNENVDSIDIQYVERLKLTIHLCTADDFLSSWCEHTMDASLFDQLSGNDLRGTEDDLPVILEESGFGGLPVELYDNPGITELASDYWDGLVEERDIRGIVHNHSTYSDGMNTLEEMSLYVRDKGYAYFAICDHSRSAFYANGLQEDRVLDQMAEIDRLNAKLAPFKVFKGIESDILSDGSLDYEPEMLDKFDLVVASIHSNLRMDEEKAMMRLIRAIENPFTRILGHPTGRLLLARKGYPVDHRRLIDACSANGVTIELNANPLRLDIDYTWLEYCMEKGVLVAINPDAHSRAQVDYVKYGVYAARKGGLKAVSCLNAFSLNEFENWLAKK